MAGLAAVAISIFNTNGLVVNTTTSPSAAGYKNYAYDYALPENVPYGSYVVAVSYRPPCGETVNGQGIFQVTQGNQTTEPWAIQVNVDKSAYIVGDSVQINGTVTGGPGYFVCPPCYTCFCTSTATITASIHVLSQSGEVYAQQYALQTVCGVSRVYHFSAILNTASLGSGQYTVLAEASTPDYPKIQATTSFSLTSQQTGQTGIPGFPIESILAGLVLGSAMLAMISKRTVARKSE
jgi:hypothetical protein